MRASTICRLLPIAVLLLASMHPALADGRRVALVIGNSLYRNVPRLENPANDAKLVAKTLSALGFTLVGGGAQTNLDKAGFAAAVRSFGQALPGAKVALFYYAGHGLQVSGENWLVPVDANPVRVQDLDFQMVDAALVLKQMEGAGTKLNVMVLDACRNNPFGGRGLRGGDPGLAQMQAPEGTLISYATQPGNVAQDGAGADSPYTLALVEAMQQPGYDVLRMFNRVGVAVKRGTGGAQQPWVSTSPIEGEYFFAGAGNSGVALAPLPNPTPAPSGASRAPGGLLARVAAKAQPDNIPVPEFFDISAPGPDVPPDVAKFVGIWGPGHWGTGPNHIIVAVEHVDAAGRARVVYLQSSACPDHDCTPALRKPLVQYHDAKIENGHLTWDASNGFWRYVFEIDADGTMHATIFKDLTILWARAVMSRID